MGFFKKIKNSIYSPHFYASVSQTKLRSAIGYFLLLSLFLAILQSILPIYNFYTNARPAVNNFIGKIKDIYPSELVIKIQDGKVTSNVQEPYFIAMPSEISGINNDETVNLVVIDTVTPYSIEQFNQYKTFAWIAKDSVIARDSNGINITDLSDAKNFTLNKSVVDSFFTKISPWLKWITPAAIVFILLAFYISYAIRFIYLFFLAALIWLLLKLIDRPLSYGNSYKVGLYAITLSLIIELVLGVFNIHGFTLMNTIIALAIVWINIRSSAKTSPQSMQPTQSIETSKPQATQPVQQP